MSDVEIRISTKGEADTRKALQNTEKAIKGVDAATDKAGRGSRNFGSGLDRVSKHAGGLESGMGGLADGISGVTTLMEGGAQGGAGMALAFADIGSAASNTAIPAVKGLSRGLSGIKGVLGGVGKAASGDFLGGLAKGTKGLGLFGAGVKGLVDKLGGIKNILLGGGIVAGIAGLAVAMKQLEQQRSAKALDEFYLALKRGEKVPEDTAAKLLLARAAFGELDTELRKIANESGIAAAERFVDMAQAAGAPKEIMASLKGELRLLRGELGDTADETERVSDRIRGMNDALRAQFDPVFAAADAQRGLNDALARQAEVNKNAESTAADKAAADAAVRKAVVDLESATNDLNTRVREGTLDVEEASRQFVDMATRMGIPEAEARRLADQIYGATKRSQELGRQRPTPVLRVRDLASGQINAVRGLIRNFGGTVATATLRLQVIGLQEANRARALAATPYNQAHGGIIGGLARAQTGGIRGNHVLVGEHGPELVRLPVGSMVRSNPDTRRALGAGGGAPVEVVLSYEGGHDKVADALMEGLRARIRVTGGRGTDSVQRALGYRS
jgi:hypothetical protein